MLMVHAGMPLFLMVLTFGFVTWSITSYCLSSKTCQVLSHQPLAMLAVVTPLDDLSICLQRPFCLWVWVQMWLCSEVGEVAPSALGTFEGKKKKPNLLSGFLLPCTDFSHQLWCGTYFTPITFMKRAQVDNYSPTSCSLFESRYWIAACCGLRLRGTVGTCWHGPLAAASYSQAHPRVTTQGSARGFW